ncbi:trypsin-like serine peptidase [Bifidobacterium aerophilum]|uniref:trypsin-like serine peptidase n=1 Tax=Bifidobacterium aerophilum TaxID=1798155 RepID=UPI0013D85609|nr:trypsin-like peptidase domain-containing protein [Bifidobacterium aerophilum]
MIPTSAAYATNNNPNENDILPITSNSYYSDSTTSYTINNSRANPYTYWNQENINNAISNRIDITTIKEDGSHASTIENDITTTFQPTPPSAPEIPSARSGFDKDQSSKPTGLLLFSTDDGQGSCTASLINSSSKKLILTAAHCLHDGKNKNWHSNFMFAPNAAPTGGSHQMYPGGTARVFTDWINKAELENESIKSSDIPNDIGFITINSSILPSGTAELVKKYGGHGFGHSNLGNFDATIIGYPADPGDNQIPQSCTSKVTTVSPLNIGNILQATDCSFKNARGASGGPWLQLYNSSTGIGWANGLSSAANEESQILYSPRFNDRTYKLYNDANKDGL